ncbi:Hypothetical protein A7982_04640 [Minicystis rosea]|nr:Hypothetical protein A7982_04640 [Minicystis rosea]
MSRLSPSHGFTMRVSAVLLAALLGIGCGDGGTTGTSSGDTTTGMGGHGGAGGADAGSMPTVCAHSTAWTPPPACGSNTYAWHSMIADPSTPEFDAALAAKIDRFDRQHHVFNAFATGLNSDASVPPADTTARQLIEGFIQETDGWDFDAYAMTSVSQVVSGGWNQSSGAYSGPGAAADAFRYGTLRDQGADCDAIERARAHVLADLDALHVATAITGIPGGIARGLARVGLPGDGSEATTPLFDDMGNPLPEKKNNGTWRADNSGGKFPDYIWVDSCSRDMIVGWAIGYAGVWEVIRLDPTFPAELKQRLQEDAAAIVRSLRKVGDQGYDLEIHDPDGRVSMFGYLNENAIDTSYLKGANNGFQAIMAVGIVGAFGYVAEQADIDGYLYDELIATRKLDTMARDNLIGVDLGTKANYSNYNMAFDAGWLAQRYLCQDAPRAVIRQAIETSLYARPGRDRQPAEQKMTMYDFTYVAAHADATADKPLGEVDEAAVARGMETMVEFPDAPFWEANVANCDEAEITSGLCTAADGTTLHLLGYVGRGDTLVSQEPVPMRTRPPSNYFWRTDPYLVNGGGDGTRLLAANDLRFTYWMGRWLRR